MYLYFDTFQTDICINSTKAINIMAYKKMTQGVGYACQDSNFKEEINL